MINLRYHIVSITAIFLALGIGVALGSTFLDKATVDQLETNIARAEKRIDDTRAQSRQLQTQVDQANRRDDALKALGSQELFVGMLSDDPVLVITYDGTDKQSLATLTDTLVGADADLEGTLTIDSGFLADADRTADRAKCLGLPETSSAGTVRRSIAQRLGDALVDASRSTGQTPAEEDSTTTTALPRSPEGEPEIITQLRACGLMSYTPPEGGSADDPVLVGTDNRFVFASNAAPPVSDDTLLMPMLRHQVEQRPSTALVVASAAVDDDPEATRTTVVGPIRGDDDLSAATSTVDDLESFSGVAATVLALRDVDRDVYGHYGVGGGATAQLPQGT